MLRAKPSQPIAPLTTATHARALSPPPPPPSPSFRSGADFYEWNARVQLTTWNPTVPGATQIPGGPIDYASKHWSGLISGYYGSRAAMAQRMALQAAAGGQGWDKDAWTRAKATHASIFQLDTTPLPTQPVGDHVKVTAAMQSKYAPYFEPYCAA